MKTPPWSYTTLTKFETCPWQYYKTKVTREVKEPPTEHTVWGNSVHAALEARVKRKTPLPEGMQRWEALAKKFDTAPAVVRLSVCRTSLNGERWQDGISWDDLQRLKRECGYGNADAIEVFPADADVVNVANMRHLWIMAEPIECAWRKPNAKVRTK